MFERCWNLSIGALVLGGAWLLSVAALALGLHLGHANLGQVALGMFGAAVALTVMAENAKTRKVVRAVNREADAERLRRV